MTKDVFWERIETAIGNGGDCDICPVQEYAIETKTERICDHYGDCADGLRELSLRLEHGSDGRENNN